MRPHISLNVKDVPKSVAFYQKVFGATPQKLTPNYAKFDLKEPALNFAMQTVNSTRLPSQVNHFGIEVESVEEVSKWKKRLEELKVDVLVEEGVDCCYAMQDKVWFRDPDNNSWEVFFVHAQLPLEGAQPPKIAAQSCSTKSGCC